MSNDNQPHILNASSNLLGICFVLITGLKITGFSKETWLDEIAVIAAILLVSSCIFSYLSIRADKKSLRYEKTADGLFLAALIFLFVAVVIFGASVL